MCFHQGKDQCHQPEQPSCHSREGCHGSRGGSRCHGTSGGSSCHGSRGSGCCGSSGRSGCHGSSSGSGCHRSGGGSCHGKPQDCQQEIYQVPSKMK
ncbi:LOW QUALITY PROTEIN: uncharacterized protein FYN16_013530 [Cariama cristata]|uniref:LOW QUALITY PROTEIN: loricrin-like n=1 Tax=Cariama cristata TaxID=54380 RepID=UPI0005206A3A|nr:PREDICTED: LOW QUALITY PROTEIN: loricrin-like [Cariama cristata]